MSTISFDLHLTAAFLAAATKGTLFAPEDTVIRGVSIDSRNVKDGDLFVAIAGERTDGHAYVQQAIDAGASCVLVSRPIDPSLPHVLVDNTTAALGRLAHAYRTSLSPITVGVTGSVGKTTTKQLISCVLSVKYRTHRTEGNFNNELGLPLTLLALTEQDEAAVLEMGMSAIGEIEYLSRLALPDIGVITCIGTSHIENLGSRERIRDAKLEIRAGMKPDGTLVMNGDEPLLQGIENAVYVGFQPEGKQKRTIKNLRSTEDGTAFDLEDESGNILRDLTIPGTGSHLAFDAALACVVGQLCGMSEAQIKLGLSQFQNTGMRQMIEVFGGITLINDCYNAAPESMKAALNVLRELPAGGKRIAVLGDMLELGSYANALHFQVGAYAASSGVDRLVTFGPLSALIAEGAAASGMPQESILSFSDVSDPESVASALRGLASPSDAILFKASRGTALERVINQYKEMKTNGR